VLKELLPDGENSHTWSKRRASGRSTFYEHCREGVRKMPDEVLNNTFGLSGPFMITLDLLVSLHDPFANRTVINNFSQLAGL
jgi:hypothetical protein